MDHTIGAPQCCGAPMEVIAAALVVVVTLAFANRTERQLSAATPPGDVGCFVAGVGVLVGIGGLGLLALVAIAGGVL